MQALPVIVGFGGYNAAGRSSSHQAFRRLVLESLSQEEQEQTIASLACLMKLVSWNDQFYTDYQDFILLISYHSPELLFAVSDFTSLY